LHGKQEWLKDYLGESSSSHLNSPLIRGIDLEVMSEGAVETQEAKPRGLELT